MQDDLNFDGPNLFIANQLRRKSIKAEEEADKQHSAEEIDQIRTKLAKLITR